jgi:hypothetical protein
MTFLLFPNGAVLKGRPLFFSKTRGLGIVIHS